MDLQKLQDYCHTISLPYYPSTDPSHDINHIIRVVNNALFIAKHEWWDLEIIIPAAYFHDIVNYPKNDPRRSLSTDHSAELAKKLLEDLDGYPEEKIPEVQYCILHCSFTKNLDHDSLESKIIQDADLLESTGVISLMRTCASSGIMQRPLLDMKNDPLALTRIPEGHFSAYDLIQTRLLKVYDRMLTQTGKKLALSRHQFLYKIMDQIQHEIDLEKNFGITG